VADLTGDGQLDFVIKWLNQNPDVIQSGFTAPVIFQAVKLDGTVMWEVNAGINVRAGQHYLQPMLYDFDGDGKAELMFKTAPGTIDGLGRTLNMDGKFMEGSVEYQDFRQSDRIYWNRAERVIRGNDPVSGQGGAITPTVFDAATVDDRLKAAAEIEKGEFFQLHVDFFLGWNSHPDVVGRSYWDNLDNKPWNHTTKDYGLTWLPGEDQATAAGVPIGWWVSPPQIMLGMHTRDYVCSVTGRRATANGIMATYEGARTRSNAANRRQAPGWTEETFNLLNSLPKCPIEFRRMEITREIATALTWQMYQQSFIRRDNDSRNYDNDRGYIQFGHVMTNSPEFFTVFCGVTGKALDTIPYLVPMEEPNAGGGSMRWNDYTFYQPEPWNRSERHLGAVAYLDGNGAKTASAVQIRGYYSRTSVMRYDWDGVKLTGTIIADSGFEAMPNPFNAKPNYLDGTGYSGRHGAAGRYELAFNPDTLTGYRPGFGFSVPEPGANWNNGSFTVQGQHSMSVWDVDYNDPTHHHHGRDTIFIGAAAFYAHACPTWTGTTDQNCPVFLANARLRWTGYYPLFGGNDSTPEAAKARGNWQKLGHGDSMHFAYFHPNQENITGWMCLEGARADEALINLRTGEVTYWMMPGSASSWSGGRDVGRSIAGNFTNEPGWQLSAAGRHATPFSRDSGGLRQFDGWTPSAFNVSPANNFSMFWSADLSTNPISGRDNPTVHTLNERGNGWVNLLQANGTYTHGGTKGQPALVVDLFGDHREELIVMVGTQGNRAGAGNQHAMRIYFNVEESPHKVASLMTDRRYRVETARQNTTYNQPTYPGFYYGRDMDFGIYYNSLRTYINNDPAAFGR
jgi:hypothetical protein